MIIPIDLLNFFADIKNQKKFEINTISQILLNDSDIKEKYIMSNTSIFSYNTDSNYVYAHFRESTNSDSIEQYILRESWSQYDMIFSDIGSVPRDRNNLIVQVPNYLIYLTNEKKDNLPWIIDMLERDTSNNFEKIYDSNQTSTVAYRIFSP